MAGLLRGTGTNSIGGPARLLYAPLSYPMPTRIAQIVDTSGGTPTYNPTTGYGFIDIGITRTALTITVQHDAAQWDNQQFGRYRTVPTNSWGTVATEALEMTQANKVALMGAVAATDPVVNQHQTNFVALTEFPEYRMAAVFKDRGKFHATVFPHVIWEGGAVATALERGAAQAIPFSFTAIPDDTVIDPTTGQAIFRIDFDEF